MAVMAPVPGFSLAALARFSASLPLPEAAAAPDKQSRLPDVVVFSSAPMRVLSDLASAGLRQLAALLPMIEQAVQEESAAPLGHLAQAAGAAARQIGEGHAALIAEGPDRVAAALRGEPMLQGSAGATDTKLLLRSLVRQIGAETEAGEDVRPNEALRSIARQIGAPPEPRVAAEPGGGPIQRWLAEAKHLLRSTGEALDRVEEQLRPLAAAEPASLSGQMPMGWALAQVVAAQAQVAGAYAAVGRGRSEARAAAWAAPRSFPLDQMAGATTLLGGLLILAALWLLGGVWWAATGLGGLAGTAVWVWRISRASRHVRLDARG